MVLYHQRKPDKIPFCSINPGVQKYGAHPPIQILVYIQYFEGLKTIFKQELNNIEALVNRMFGPDNL